MPLADEFAKGMLSTISNISQQFPAVDKNVLAQAVAPGGAISQTLGFNDPKELLGLTPEAFQQSMALRSQLLKDNMGMVKDLTALSDVISGNAETRQAMYNAAPQIFNAQMQEGLQGQRFAQEDKTNEANRQFQAQENALARAQADRQLAETRRFHDMSISEQRANRKLRERELTKLSQAMEGDPTVAANYFPVNQTLYGHLETQVKNYSDANNGGPKSDKYRSPWVQAFMKQQAMGAPYGTFYKTNSFSDVLGNYQYLRLTPSGWYGANKVGNKWQNSKAPIIPFSADMAKKGGAGRGGQIQVPKYAPAED